MHARRAYGDAKEVDQTYRKLRLRLAADLISDEWTEVDEVDAINYMVSSVFDFATRPVFCTHCSFAHSDRDWFAVHPHRRHQCHGCGFQFSEAVTRRRSCCRTRSAAALKCCPSTSTSAHWIRRANALRSLAGGNRRAALWLEAAAVPDRDLLRGTERDDAVPALPHASEGHESLCVDFDKVMSIPAAVDDGRRGITCLAQPNARYTCSFHSTELELVPNADSRRGLKTRA